jgi:hypothetical protein
MTPTNKLRFVERYAPSPEHGKNVSKAVRILQQWWEDDSTDVHWIDGNPGAWRDVPIEKETT